MLTTEQKELIRDNLMRAYSVHEIADMYIASLSQSEAKEHIKSLSGAVIAPRYEIQTWVGNEWVNLWRDAGENGERIPVTFASEAEARHELCEYFREQITAYEAGLIYDLSDFENHRIEEIVE